MDEKTLRQLEEAKAHFYLGQMAESYNILRRYFDRLPFKPEKGHAQYIGIFSRILFELGKEFELKFYVGELERLYEKSPDPAIAYPLAVVYSYLSEPRLEVARGLLEKIVKNPMASEYHAKAKMMLADYYSRKQDIGACRQLIDSIGPTEDMTTALLVDVWRAVICRREKKYEEALSRLARVLEQVTPESQWYVYFSAKVIVAMTLIDQGKLAEAKGIVADVRALFAGRQFKSVLVQLGALEKLMAERSELGVIRFSSEDSTLCYADKQVRLTGKSPTDKLLLLLLRKRYLDKPLIVKNLYDRSYGGEKDDKLVYYHIHSLRKRLKRMGLPRDVIANEGHGYRWVPTVETVGRE